MIKEDFLLRVALFVIGAVTFGNYLFDVQLIRAAPLAKVAVVAGFTCFAALYIAACVDIAAHQMKVKQHSHALTAVCAIPTSFIRY